MVKESDLSKKRGVTKSQRDELLIENFVGLQKAMTNLSIKFEKLSDNVSRLLGVLELSAKSYLTKEGNKDENSPDMVKQINYLIDQNKAIAEGLLLIDDTIRRKSSKEEHQEESSQMKSKPLPQTI